MSERDEASGSAGEPGVNPGYAAFQLARALTTAEEHDDPEIRERAIRRVAKWQTVLANVLDGSVNYGSRTPVSETPAWATLEVVTGGFATGHLLAGGPIQDHERRMLEALPGVTSEGDERRALNAHFLSDAGLGQLSEWLHSGCYDVVVPEEGALLAVAALIEHGDTERARALLEELSPFFSKLRFYPIPLERPRRFGSRVYVQDVESTVDSLNKIEPKKRIEAQKNAVSIWLPLYDRMVALFLETVEEAWPCQIYPEGWSERALALLDEYAELKKKHRAPGKMERAKGHAAQLRVLLGRCAKKPKSLTGKEVGRIRRILETYVAKRGEPGSASCLEARQRQADHVSAPGFHEIARVVAPRLEGYPKNEGLDEVGHLLEPVSKEEALRSGVPEGTSVPPSITRKLERCLCETVDVLVERGLITSGETVARVLPQVTSGLRAVGITEPTLRQLYAAIYRAFRSRRSLLLLNLEKQVQIEELPWVAAIEQFRDESLSSRELAKQTLEEITAVVLTSFPHVILPNKLLQELRALVKGAGLDVPLVDELAADIFMGEFSPKFVASAHGAADLLEDSLYARYYGIDYRAVRELPLQKERPQRRWFMQARGTQLDELACMCAARAGVSLGTWDPATNGMILEQQQILTTQNLAATFVGFDLLDRLSGELRQMAERCFEWVCRRQQMKMVTRHAHLIAIKNTAYAWRQMVFYLALLPGREVAAFLQWAQSHLEGQPADFQERFGPAWRGLVRAGEGELLEQEPDPVAEARCFLGWSKERHWLLRSTR